MSEISIKYGGRTAILPLESLCVADLIGMFNIKPGGIHLKTNFHGGRKE